MGDQAWSDSANVVFPDVVLGLFADDAARLAPPVANRSAAASASKAAAAGVCSDLAGWVNGVLETIVNALKVDTSQTGPVGTFFGNLWNTVVELAADGLGFVVGALTAPVVSVITTALGIAGTLSMVAGFLRPWSVTATQEPSPASYGVGQGDPVEVVARVDTGGSQAFSSGIIDCANAAGIALPDPTDAKGSAVTWKSFGVEEVGTGISSDEAVAEDGTARLRFTTRTESQDAADHGEPVPHTTAVNVSIERTQVRQLQQVVSGLIQGLVPGVLAPVVDAVFGLITQPIVDGLAELLGTYATGLGTVISHTQPEPDDAPATTTSLPECATLGPGVIPDGTWAGPIELGVTGSTANTSGQITTTGGGQLQVTVEEGEVTGGTWSLDFRSSGTLDANGATATIESMAGHAEGAVGGTAAVPHLSGRFSLNGNISATVSGFAVDVPIAESGGTEVDLTMGATSCDEVTGDFVPSFTQATGGYAVSGGVARWTAAPG
jgi:hypothetical protein